MKNTDTAEIVVGANGTDEVAERQPAQDRRWAAYRPHADSEYSHGVAGSDELASSPGKSAGGVRVAGGIFGAADARHAPPQETQSGGADGQERGGRGADRKARRGGAGPFRQV